MLKTHLDIISRNEPIQRKARFWQSYMRALKGTDDMRAPEQSRRTPRSIFRPLYDFPESKLESWPYTKSIYDEPTQAHDRISSPGYRYQPISRDTYGYTPRTSLYRDTYRPDFNAYKKADDATRAWEDHQNRMADIDARYPSAMIRHRISPSRSLSPAPTWHPKPGSPSEKALGYTYAGLPIYKRSSMSRPSLDNLFNPSIHMPPSRIIRDPWWWAYPELRPFESPYTWRHSPSYLRNSYLSPVKSTYLWTHHPIRPF